jgi:hypothetical protein
VRKFFNRLFSLEEINGADLCPTYMYRWTLLSTRWAKVYVHKFVAEDWSKDLHDHPKRFITIGLRGQYREFTASGEKVYRAPWIRSFPATHTHRLTLIDDQPCWTLAIVFKASRQWGFWHDGKWVYWRDYVGSETADKMKSCS